MRKVYETAIIVEDTEIPLPIRIYEYDNLKEQLNDLCCILKSDKFKDYHKIELSINDVEEDGENINNYCWAEINLKEFNLGLI